MSKEKIKRRKIKRKTYKTFLTMEANCRKVFTDFKHTYIKYGDCWNGSGYYSILSCLFILMHVKSTFLKYFKYYFNIKI